MVKKGTGPALDQLLCERVEAVVTKYTGGSFARERVLTALREVLDSATLSREEEELREKKRAEGLRGQELLNCLIGARVERALHVALEAAVGSAESTHLAELPRILVLRGEVDLSGLAIPDAESGERAQETLILTDRAGLEQLTSAPTLTARAVQVFGDEDDGAGPTVTLPSGAEAAAHSAELHDLAATLSVHMGERPSGAPPPPVGTRVDWTGRTLAGKYEIVRLLGRGGFGAVYQARDRVLGTGVAIKVLNPGASRSSADLEAFKNEARRVTRLDHPNIVGWKVFDELDDGTLYFVMELIQGEELEDVLEREKRLAPRRVARLLLQIVDALRAAHHISESESILHLDLKPRNVFLIKGTTEGGTDERAKVIDFGIGQYLDRLAPLPARALEPEPEAAHGGGTPGDSDSATANTPRAQSGSSASSYLSGSEVGGTMVSVRHADLARAVDQERTTHVTRCNACTPEYASPEQCEHMDPTAQIRELDGRSDLYSLGVMGFRMLTGELPFKRPKKRRGWLELQRFEPPRRVRDVNPRVPKALARFIDRCLEKERDARPDSNAAYEALYEIVHPKAKTLQTVAVVVLVGALIGAVAWFNRARVVVPVVARHVDGAAAVSEPVHLGPAQGRGAITLKIPDPEGRFDSPSVELVDAEGASLAPWLTATWTGDDTLRLAATERLTSASGRSALAGRLALREGDRRAESQELRFVYLGREWLSVFSVGVPGLGDDDLDPRRQQLRIELRCAEPEGLVVRARSGELDLRVVPYTQSSEAPPEGHVLFGALLDGLAGLQTAGPVPAVVDVEVLDPAGNVFRPVSPFTARIDARDLALVSLRMQDSGPAAAGITPVNRRYLLYPETRPRLELVTNRAAEVEIELFAEGVERALESTIRVGTAVSGETGGAALVAFDFAPAQHLAAGQKTLSGEVRVLVRDRGILRERPQEVRPPRDLLFTFTEEKAGFRLRLAGRDTAELRTAEPGPLEIEVTRLGGVTSQVRLAGTGPEGALAPATRELGLADPIQTFLLPIEREGVYELELGAYRSEGGEVGTQADHTERVRVVVDRTPPALVLGGAAGPMVLASGAGALPLRLSLGPAEVDAEPVRLLWTLDGAELADPAALGLPETLGAAPVTVGLPSASDGRHTLEVRAVDAAGNAAELDAPLEWTVALAPPALSSWIAPKQGLWSSDDAGVFHVEVELSDPNGIGAVSGRVVPLDGAPLEEGLVFAPDAERSGVWTAATSLSPEWSHKEVEIHVVASDGMDAALVNDPPFTRARSLGLVVRAYPERVARAQSDRTPMRLIRSNRELAYEFKGREDAVENEAFAKSGLPAYSERNERRSWKLDYPPGTIQDFYLDEREVTNAQFRAFMRATGHSGPPYLSEAGYAFSADEEPVVLVTWEEAAAYADWVGKRLPSYVEWEYAVRGGPLRYRLYSTWTPERATPPEEIVAASGWSAVVEAAFTKHAAGRSSDVTPEGVHDLCGNVAEWTATPLFFGADRPANLMTHARAQKQGYLRPWTLPGWDRQPEYWIVGGAFDLPGAHFARTDQRPRDARLANTGFRCAQDAERVLLGVEPKGSEYVEVRP